MTAMADNELAGANWRKLAVLVLGVAIIGLPVNDLTGYALLTVMAVVVFNGEVIVSRGAWQGAAVIVAVAMIGQSLLAPPRIDERSEEHTSELQSLTKLVCP